jgi:hypothetical protein
LVYKAKPNYVVYKSTLLKVTFKGQKYKEGQSYIRKSKPVWWLMPIIPTLRRQRQEDDELEAWAT